MLFPFLILAAPEEIFERITSRAPWFPPLAYCTLGFFVVTWLGGCWENISEGLRLWSLLGPAVVSVLFVGAALLGSTTVLYCAKGASLSDSANRRGYRMLFSLNAHCALIVVLGEAINLLLVHANILTEYDFRLANRFPLGLDLLILGVKEPNIYLAVLLHSTSVFILWYFVVLTRGLKQLTGSSLKRAAATAATLWLIGVGAVVGIVYSAGGGTIFRVTM